MENIVQFPTKSVRDWLAIESAMNDALSNGVIKGLILEDILYRSSSVSLPRHGFMSFAFNIQPWAWEYLNKHSYLLNHKNYKL